MIRKTENKELDEQVKDIIELSEHLIKKIKIKESRKNDDVVFWGAGNRFEEIVKFWQQNNYITPKFVIDSTKSPLKNFKSNIEFKQFDEIYNYDTDKTLIIITAGLLDLQSQIVSKELYYYEIIHIRSIEMATYLMENTNQLEYSLSKLSNHDSKKTYLNLLQNILSGRFYDPSLYSPNAYFNNAYISEIENGTLLFAGAFNGKHIIRFLKNNSNINILAFEPNPMWFLKTSEKFIDYKNIEIRNSLLGKEKTEVFFDPDVENHGLSARVEKNSTNKTISLKVSKLDEEISTTNENERVSQIVLDVEGAEPETLIGAKKIIKNYLPNLSICIYHNPHDFLNMIKIIENICSDAYNYYILQHSCISNIETVLYCIPKNSRTIINE